MKQYANIVDKKDESWIIEFRINELPNQKNWFKVAIYIWWRKLKFQFFTELGFYNFIWNYFTLKYFLKVFYNKE